MTDIEMVIDEIKKFQEKQHNVTNINEDSEHLVFLCHQNTEKIVHDAIKENGLEIDNKYIHIFVSNYYSPGEVYLVMDKKVKRMILIAKKIINPVKEKEITFSTNYTVNYTINGQYGYYYTCSTIPKKDLWKSGFIQ